VQVDAQKLKRDRTRLYTIAKWSSYALFVIGWGLAFYGKLFNDGDPEDQNEEAM
jgi:hypothetical protein